VLFLSGNGCVFVARAGCTLFARSAPRSSVNRKGRRVVQPAAASWRGLEASVCARVCVSCVRVRACMRRWERVQRRLLPVVFALLKDPDPRVRRAAVGQVGDVVEVRSAAARVCCVRRRLRDSARVAAGGVQGRQHGCCGVAVKYDDGAGAERR
jgi:HEAT repeat